MMAAPPNASPDETPPRLSGARAQFHHLDPGDPEYYPLTSSSLGAPGNADDIARDPYWQYYGAQQTPMSPGLGTGQPWSPNARSLEELPRDKDMSAKEAAQRQCENCAIL
jgi:hypothetical protein